MYILLSAPLVLVSVFRILFNEKFTMARHYEHRPIFNIGHIGENENYTLYGNKVCIFIYDEVGFY